MTYSELKTNIASWMHRSDLTAQMDTFIDLFEARANRSIRTVEMETLESFTPSSEFHPIPTDFLEFRNVQANLTYTKPLEYASPQKIAAFAFTSGDPHFYAFNGNQVEFSPSASGKTIEWTYYKAIPALSDSNTTNWLLTKYPDYYLMGCIHQALVWTMNDRAMQVDAIVQNMEANINAARNRNMAGPLAVTSI